MKIINPNHIEKNEFHRDSNKLLPIIDSIAALVNIDIKHVQYLESEKEGLVYKCRMHPLIQAADLAFSKHLPLVLSPDIIWYCIANGVAIYINKHSEELKDKFVNHKDKKRIVIIRDDFIFGEKNPWNEVIDDFSEIIKQNTNNNIVDTLQADFTTTSKIARVSSQIVIMDAMQKYFDYYTLTRCGIPEIRLLGEKSDWERIKQRANNLVEIIPGLQEWINGLDAIFNEFINAFDDKIDKNFWNSIYKVSNASGGPYINGWLILFFPFLKDGEENQFCWDEDDWKSGGLYNGLRTNNFAYHLNQVPFTWNYLDTEIDMLFVGGLVGLNVDENDSALTPIFGYAVMEDKKIDTKPPID